MYFMHKPERFLVCFPIVCAILLLVGCSATRHVHNGDYLLDEVNIEITGDKEVSSRDLINYLKQSPNHEVLGFGNSSSAPTTFRARTRQSGITAGYAAWVRPRSSTPSRSLTPR